MVGENSGEHKDVRLSQTHRWRRDSGLTVKTSTAEIDIKVPCLRVTDLVAWWQMVELTTWLKLTVIRMCMNDWWVLHKVFELRRRRNLVKKNFYLLLATKVKLIHERYPTYHRTCVGFWSTLKTYGKAHRRFHERRNLEEIPNRFSCLSQKTKTVIFLKSG